MVWGGAHFIIRDYTSIKYKIINNNPYNLINLCCLFVKRPKTTINDSLYCTSVNIAQ